MKLYENCAKKNYSYLNQLLEVNSSKKPKDIIWGGNVCAHCPLVFLLFLYLMQS